MVSGSSAKLSSSTRVFGQESQIRVVAATPVPLQ